MPRQPEREVKEEHVECRAWGHAWEFKNVKANGKELVQIMGCMRAGCETERSQRVDRFGYLMGNKYDYPEGYTMKGGGALTQKERAGLRLRGMQMHDGGAQLDLFPKEKPKEKPEKDTNVTSIQGRGRSRSDKTRRTTAARSKRA